MQWRNNKLRKWEHSKINWRLCVRNWTKKNKCIWWKIRKLRKNCWRSRGFLSRLWGPLSKKKKPRGRTNREGKNDICCFLCIWVLILEMASILKGLEGMVCMDMHYNICIIRYAWWDMHDGIWVYGYEYINYNK